VTAAGLSPARRALLERQMLGEAVAPSRTDAIRHRTGQGPAPLSFGQRQTWFLSQLAAGSPAYSEAGAVHCPPTADPDALERAFNEVLRRHEAWRTVFRIEGGAPVQVVQPFRSHRLPLTDLTRLPAADGEAEAWRLAASDLQTPLDLARGPLWRAVLVRLGDGGYRLHLTVHHAICDGISMYQVLPAELQALHDAFSRGHPSPLPPLPVQYGDFAAWQVEQVARPEVQAQRAYWREQLAGLPEVELPVDRPRPAMPGFRGASLPLAIPSPVVERLRAAGGREGATLFMAVLAAFDLLLHSYGGQEDVAVGTVISSRKRPELEGLLGYFLNPVVVRTDLSGGPTFRELLRRVRAVTLATFAHDDVPFEQVVSDVAPQRDSSRNPLFQVLMTLEPPVRRPAPGWDASQISGGIGSSKFDLHVALEERAEGLRGHLVYDTDLFEPETARRMAGRFLALLEAAAADPDATMPELVATPTGTGAPSAGERHRLLVDWNRTDVPSPPVAISRRFEEEAATRPDREAVSCGGERLSYSRLDRRANALARRLRSMGVGREALVGVCLDRSLATAVALLGILKAGAAYLPLDPQQPRTRLALMLRETAASVVITTPARWPWRSDEPPPGVRQLHLGEEEEDAGPDDGPGPSDLAYVLYTSGSTGEPKGVMVEHRSVLRLVCPATYADLGPEQVLLHLAPLAFDASTFEIWGALLNGGRLVVAPPGHLSARELGEVVEREGVTTLWLTAGLFNQVVDAGLPGMGGLRQLLTGGEAVSPVHCGRALELLPGVRLVNGYGPTEATTFTCCHPISARDVEAGPIPIGRPIGNTRVYILDGGGEPVAQGVIGELHVGGVGVARGYLEKPELTRERFIPDPFVPGGRLYRTGDLARHRPDGVVEFHGRRDRQVKVRGFRIELGEIESAIAAHPLVAEAVVEVAGQGTVESRLVAYVVARAGAEPAPGELADFLASRLPPQMVPASYVAMRSLPLTANGKVDRVALPIPPPRREPGRDASTGVDGASRGRPPTAVEERLAALWARLLGLEGIGRDESFFALGGNSLLAVRLVAEIEDDFGRPLPLASVFGRGATIAGLAGLLAEPDAPAAGQSRLLTPVRAAGSRPALFVVEPNEGPLVALRHFLPFLDEEQPVMAMLPRTADGLFDRTGSIGALAEELLQAIRHSSPHGPYRLAGYSLGGVLAYHLASRLRAGGDEVDFLALIDTMTPEVTMWHSEPLMRPSTRVRRLLLTSPRLWPAMLWAAVRRAAGEAPAVGGPGDEGPDAAGDFDSEGAVALLSRYRLPPCDARLTLFGSRWAQRWTGDRSLGWASAHHGPLVVETVPGDHRTILLQPRVSELAARFADHLDSVARRDGRC
jgi:amino acid adenylation domain-containing protein